MRGARAGAERRGRRSLIVGAGRTGRSMLRELRETPGERVVAFVDDDPRLRGRRLNGVRVAGGDGRASSACSTARSPDIVFVTIPNAPKRAPRRDRAGVRGGEIDCRFVRREIDVDPRVILGVDR